MKPSTASLAAEIASQPTAYIGEAAFAGNLAEGEAIRDLDFDACTFTGDLEGGRLVGCTFTECEFVGANLSRVDLTDSRFIDCTFTGCKVLAVNFAVMGVGAVSANPVTFERCQLDLATFQGLDARGFVFRECGLVEVDFSGADLRRASFVGSRLDGARLVRCDLREADFREATGYAIDVRDCQVKGARFSAAEALALLDPFHLRID